MAHTNIRLYFFDMGRPKGQREMREHPANGMPFCGTNRMAVDASGEYIRGTHISVEGISPRALAAGIGKPGRLNHEVSVTLSDFPEAQGAVKVKVWGPAMTTWAELRDDEPGGAEALARAVAQV